MGRASVSGEIERETGKGRNDDDDDDGGDDDDDAGAAVGVSLRSVYNACVRVFLSFWFVVLH